MWCVAGCVEASLYYSQETFMQEVHGLPASQLWKIGVSLDQMKTWSASRLIYFNDVPLTTIESFISTNGRIIWFDGFHQAQSRHAKVIINISSDLSAVRVWDPEQGHPREYWTALFFDRKVFARPYP